MQNLYDNEAFFREYANMSRSRLGLSGAGEWHMLKPLFPALNGKNVLDLGCGYGWHCRFAAEAGATVLGIDQSEAMLAAAREKNAHPAITYRHCGLEEYEYPENTFDLVVSNLVLHYVADLEAIYEKVRRTLRPGGIFLFNIEHPTFTAGVRQDWIYGPDGQPQFWPVNDYYKPGPRTTLFLGRQVEKQHHTLTQILDGLLRCGFRLDAVREAEPDPGMMHLPGMEDELRRPMMLVVKAVKPDA